MPFSDPSRSQFWAFGDKTESGNHCGLLLAAAQLVLTNAQTTKCIRGQSTAADHRNAEERCVQRCVQRCVLLVDVRVSELGERQTMATSVQSCRSDRRFHVNRQMPITKTLKLTPLPVYHIDL